MRYQNYLYAFSSNPWLRLQGLAADAERSASATATLARPWLPVQTGGAVVDADHPQGRTVRIDSRPLHQEITTHANRVSGDW
jgi:hypothetical protein